ncbi:MAG: DUF2807 domain-containing protein [Reichenbachiella sp.]
MKTSKRILLTLSGVLIALLITGLMLLRSDLHTIRLGKVKKIAVDYGSFDQIKINGNWDIYVRQRGQIILEVEEPNLDITQSLIQNIDGILIFDMPAERSGRLKVRIGMPVLKSILADSGSIVNLSAFDTNSLHITLRNDSHFSGNENIIEYAILNTVGNSSIEIIDDPYK